MFPPTRYLAWALANFSHEECRFDLATSGIPRVTWADVGVPAPDPADTNAFPRFRQAIATYNDVPVAEVLPSLGTAHAIFLAYAAVLSPGDEVLVETPGYEPLTRSAEGLGVAVRTFPRLEEEGFFVLPERVAAAIGPRTRAIVVTNLHNPSGARSDEATLRELAAIAEARGAWLIVDEVYAPFDDLPEDGVFRTSARKLAPNVICVSSLTKCYGLGDHRVGWVLAPEPVIERAYAAAIASIGFLPSTHASHGAAVFEGIGRLARRAKALSAGKRHLAERWVASIPGARWSAPREGLFGLVTLPGAGDLLPRIEAMAKEHGVIVAAGTFFGAPESFRLSWASLDPPRFEEALSLLRAGLRV